MTPFPGSLWGTVIPRPPRPSSAQSVASSDVISMDEGCCITNALQEYALALHQMTQGVEDPSDLGHPEPSTSPGEMSGTYPCTSSLRNSLRSACLSAPIFLENSHCVNSMAFQHCEGVKEQYQSGNTGFGGQVAFVDDYPLKMSELLDRETSKGSDDVSQVGTSAVLVIKQESQNLVMPA